MRKLHAAVCALVLGAVFAPVAASAEVCNPVLVESSGKAVRDERGNPVVHAGSFECPTAVEPKTDPQVRKEAKADEFRVFFAFDSDRLDGPAQAVVRQAAQQAAGKPVTVSVVGHTDRSGSEAYNQRLSERRAAAVKAGLVAAGVPAAQVATTGKGETVNAVPTKDGVREAANRRAEIAIQVR